MKIMSLKQFIQQQAREPQDNGSYKMMMTNREFIAGLEEFEDDRLVELTIGYPENDSVCVKVFGHDFTYFGD